MFAAAASSIEVDATADPRFDVETFVDRLRFMGLDRELVDERTDGSAPILARG